MKVIDNKKTSIPYKEIECGECFEFNSKCLIKGNYHPSEDGDSIIATDLSTGICYDYGPDTIVLPLNGTVTFN